jgi:hypothetical protein
VEFYVGSAQLQHELLVAVLDGCEDFPHSLNVALTNSHRSSLLMHRVAQPGKGSIYQVGSRLLSENPLALRQ